jgi:hypothetical protein
MNKRFIKKYKYINIKLIGSLNLLYLLIMKFTYLLIIILHIFQISLPHVYDQNSNLPIDLN